MTFEELRKKPLGTVLVENDGLLSETGGFQRIFMGFHPNGTHIVVTHMHDLRCTHAFPESRVKEWWFKEE